ncbi:MAG: hypothetical protein K0S33_3755 [Bacteroidetes bacterium]|jgi:hypothetical protein|nr:hypothetical protein [Bacteroidota bacterium]
MKKIVSIIFLCLLMAGWNKGKAQGSDASVAYISLNTDFVHLKYPEDSVQHDTVNMRLIFLCTEPSTLTKVYVKMGTEKDNGNILNKEFTVSLSGSDYGLTFKTMYHLNDGTDSGSTVFTPFSNGYTGFYLTASEAKYKSVKWISIYAVDKFKRKTNVKYYHIN